MKKDWKYILYLSIAFGLFIAVKLMEPRQFDWTPTYASGDKNPYGAYALNELLPSLFPGEKIKRSNKTLYELKDSLVKGENLIILAHSIGCDKTDTGALLEHVGKGATALISAQTFRGDLGDTLDVITYDYIFDNKLSELRKDSAFLRFVNPHLDPTAHYPFMRGNIHNYFGYFDSTRTSVIARNDFDQPVTLRMRWGKGSLILNCTPLAFTNIYALSRNNPEFAAITLSHLPLRPTLWTEYYSVGRLESGTPLRFILTQEPLAWAYYITVLSILLFMIFESRRRQRAIPVIHPPQNTSLEFVTTIGNLYFQRGDHRNIAEKKILFFFDEVRNRYSLNPASPAEDFVPALSRKSGMPLPDVSGLFRLIEAVRRKTVIQKEELTELNQKIESFQKSHAR